MLVVTETEYTGAGKHIQPQLAFARENGIELRFGNPSEDLPGTNIILPENPGLFQVKDVDLNHLRQSLIKKSMAKAGVKSLTEEDVDFLAQETGTDADFVKKAVEIIGKGERR